MNTYTAESLVINQSFGNETILDSFILQPFYGHTESGNKYRESCRSAGRNSAELRVQPGNFEVIYLLL